MSRRNLVLALFLLVPVGALIGQAFLSRDDMRRNLPESFEASRPSFQRSFASGFGPGANETGFAVLALPEVVANRIAEGGIPWLDAQAGGRLRPNWQPTPVPRDDFWMGRPDSATGSYPAPTVLAVIERYGFPVAVPDAHRTALDTALDAPGSFYAFGPGGLVAVVVPAARRVYVFYAG